MAKKKKMDKLSWENAQALACHMSYGKWKAMQEPVKIVPKTESTEGWQPCERCGTLFKPKKGKRFCNDLCRIATYNETGIHAKQMREYREKRKAAANG